MTELERPFPDSQPRERDKLVLLRPLSKRSQVTAFLIYAAWAMLLTAFDYLLRLPGDPVQLRPGRSAVMASVVLSAVGLAAGAFRLVRERDDRAVFLASGYLVVYPLAAHAMLGSFLPQVMLAALLPGLVMVTSFVRIVRKADELEKKILSEALSFAFVVTCGGLALYGFAEVFGAPRPPAAAWTLLLFASCHLGLRIVGKRYRG